MKVACMPQKDFIRIISENGWEEEMMFLQTMGNEEKRYLFFLRVHNKWHKELGLPLIGPDKKPLV